MSTPQGGGRRTKIVLAAVAVVVLVSYIRALSMGMGSIDFGGGVNNAFLYVSSGESRLWLAHGAMAMPAIFVLVGLAAVRGQRWIARWVAALATPQPSRDRALALLWFALLTLVYRAGRVLCLYDLPLTDDETSAQFGGRVLASGHLMVPELGPPNMFSRKFLVAVDGMITSADWPGVLSFSALSELAGSEIPYAMWAALGGVAVVVLAGKCFGRAAMLTAAAAWLASPMVLSLSMTTHAHVVSRTLVALAAVLYVRLVADETPARPATAVLLGLTVGAGFATRPFETAAICGPIGIHVAFRAVRAVPGARAQLVGVLIGFSVVLALFAAYNHAISGSVWVPPRRMPNALMDGIPTSAWHERLGLHVGFNLMWLGTFALGAVALPVMGLGLAGAPTPMRVLAAGFGASLLLMLGHDNVGIHTVGPIHYSEAVVVLIPLFAGGIARLATWLETRGENPHLATWWGGCYALLVVGLGFTLPYAVQLRGHGQAADAPYALLYQKGIHHAIVIAPPTRALHPSNTTGSWKLMMPPPDPFLRDDIAFALWDADPQALHDAYPDRDIYRFEIRPGFGITAVPRLFEGRDAGARR